MAVMAWWRKYLWAGSKCMGLVMDLVVEHIVHLVGNVEGRASEVND